MSFGKIGHCTDIQSATGKEIILLNQSCVEPLNLENELWKGENVQATELSLYYPLVIPI